MCYVRTDHTLGVIVWLREPPLSLSVFFLSTSLQDSDDEANDDDDDDTLAKPVMKKEFSHRSPSPPAEDSEPEMTEEEKEFQLVCAQSQSSFYCY